MANGDLNQFLKEKELTPGLSLNESDEWEDAGQYVSPQALFYMAKTSGGWYEVHLLIETMSIVILPRENCLVGHAYTVKIADFGMSRNLYCKHYYRIEDGLFYQYDGWRLNVFLQGRFTTASDVWAYGVTLWEILTLAREYPYSELTDEEVIANVQKMFHGPDTPFTTLPQATNLSR
ncbi:hypothetical protein OS493_014770 [Desmophyllum pertusum]|uniref:receptor protein-tyrosine kinase n=1 Tax=Desmophyllum pertusum TaxID=174260 RepID=A0A9W9YDC2_9CNID|nr:hypothetical protein OS493_014770 [Desmophyllum pertusum]